jgi:hypothetical protein
MGGGSPSRSLPRSPIRGGNVEAEAPLLPPILALPACAGQALKLRRAAGKRASPLRHTRAPLRVACGSPDTRDDNRGPKEAANEHTGGDRLP